jgi:hypothetical protein
MTTRVSKLLQQYGPMLSGDLARIFENTYNVSNETARQALSRAKDPVCKIQTLSFEKNQKFFYLSNQYKSQRYSEELLNAIETSSKVNWSYICAFRSQNGFVSKDLLPALVSSPIKRVKGHKMHQRVLDDLLKCQIIEEYDEDYWKLCDWIPVQSKNFPRAVGLETVKKQLVRDFARWARNINLIGYNSAKALENFAEFAQFQWALTCPSYTQPLFDIKKGKPGFVVADVFYGKVADVQDIQFFLQKLAIIRNYKKISNFLPIFLAETVSNEALMQLKENKVTIAVIKNIFDKRYAELLAEIVNLFTNSSAIILKNPGEIEKIFREIAEAEGRYNNLVGDMFELLAGYYYQKVGCSHLEIKRNVQAPGAENSNEIDVYVERDGKVIVVECKAMRSAIDEVFVKKWLSKNIRQIREWFFEKYGSDKEMIFQLWSLGGFTDAARELLTNAAEKTKKYKIEFFEREQLIDMAREHRVQVMVDILSKSREY